jgi:hypothetical protein
MRADDMRVREELNASGELGGEYVPRMEEVHKRNAGRLRGLIELHGRPLRILPARTVPKRRGSLPSTQSETPPIDCRRD